jgi:hypothetical protein
MYSSKCVVFLWWLSLYWFFGILNRFCPKFSKTSTKHENNYSKPAQVLQYPVSFFCPPSVYWSSKGTVFCLNYMRNWWPQTIFEHQGFVFCWQLSLRVSTCLEILYPSNSSLLQPVNVFQPLWWIKEFNYLVTFKKIHGKN